MKVYEAQDFKPFNFSKSMKKILTCSNDKFNQTLLYEELLWICHFLKSINEHLMLRVAQGIKLSNQDFIKYQLAKVEADIQLLRCTHENQNIISWVIISDLIREICLSLAKLAGARALLCKNVIEMLWTFEILNQIYWVGNDE